MGIALRKAPVGFSQCGSVLALPPEAFPQTWERRTVYTLRVCGGGRGGGGVARGVRLGQWGQAQPSPKVVSSDFWGPAQGPPSEKTPTVNFCANASFLRSERSESCEWGWRVIV